MTRDETIKALAVLAAVWPGREITDPTIDGYHMAWADVPYAAVDQAVLRCIRSSRFFPAPAEIRALAADPAIPAAEVAWEEVRRRFGTGRGHYAEPAWSTGVLEQTVRAIGWATLCQCDDADLGTLRAQFYRTYEAYRSRLVRDGELGAALEDAGWRKDAALEAGTPSRALPFPSGEPVTGSAFLAGKRGTGKRDGRNARAVLEALPAWRGLPDVERSRLLEEHAMAEAGR